MTAHDATVVIPTHNRVNFLPCAIESCWAASAGISSVEIVVVDDGATDGSVELVRSTYPQVVLIPNRRAAGRGGARNTGLERAQGEFVKFLDDDDWLEPGSLAEEVRLARETNAGIVAGGHRDVKMDGSNVVHMPPALDRGIDSLLAGEAVPTAAALYRRSDVLASARWQETASKLDDWAFFVQAFLRAERVATLRRAVYSWRSHPGQGIHGTSMLQNASEFYWVLDYLESFVRENDLATPERLRRLAQYRYKELRVLSYHDRTAFEIEARRILSLDPEFLPVDEERQHWMRVLARVLGFRRALLLHSGIKKLLKG